MTTPSSDDDHYQHVFSEICSLLEEVIADYGIDFPTTPTTTLRSDLDLESFDVVRFGLALTERYGENVNLATYLAQLDFEYASDITLGDIARYVAEQIGPSAI